MKNLVYLFLFVGYIGSSQEYKIANEELKGTVKSVDLFIIGNKGAETPIEHKTYDKKGRILDSKIYYDGRIHTTERYQYFDNQIIQELCDYCNDLDKAFENFSIKENLKNPYSGYATAEPIRTHKNIKTTDKKGNVILSKTYSAEGYLSWETRRTFDKNSNLILEESYDDEGKKTRSSKKNSYNKKGLISEKIVFGTNLYSKTVYEYDSSDRKIVEKESQGDRIMEYSYEYVIEKDTSKVLTFSKSPEENFKNLRKTDISYSEKDKKITKQIALYNGKPTNTAILEYDKNDNLMTNKIYDDKNELRSEVYLIYDKKGNWIELTSSNLIQTSYNGSEPKSEWKTKTYFRKIQYH